MYSSKLRHISTLKLIYKWLIILTFNLGYLEKNIDSIFAYLQNLLHMNYIETLRS